ncbi:MAG: aldolase [Proteobacteria bacterium]|nr:aldolase [Burkholderiales bacterium]
MSVDSAVEEARFDLVCALRWAARYALHEGVCNHFSVAVPGYDDRFLINPQGLHWLEVMPDDVVTVDVDGHVIEGRHRVEPTAFYIHSRIHRARPSARCVLHTHMPYATTLTGIVPGRLEWVSQQSTKFHGRVAYEDAYNGLATEVAEGDRMAAAFQEADILFLANHGVIVCGESVATAFDDLYYLERACMLQVLGRGTGQMPRTIPREIVELTAAQMRQDSSQALLHFASLRRLLDRDEPGWRSTGNARPR